MVATSGHGHEPGYKRGCEACQHNSRNDKRALRARNRGLEPYDPESPDLTVAAGPAQPDQATERAPGAVEPAVQADIAALGVSERSNALAAAGLVLARNLDDRRLATSHASMARVVGQLMGTLRRGAAPKRGRLAVVQALARRSGPTPAKQFSAQQKRPPGRDIYAAMLSAQP